MTDKNPRLAFFEMATPDESPEPDQEDIQEVGQIRSVLHAIPKGLIKGIAAFGRMMGPLPDEPETITEEGEIVPGKKYDPEELAAFLEKHLPTREDPVSGAIERVGEIFPSVAGGPGGLTSAGAKATVAAGITGEAAKQMDLPPALQAAAEIAPFLLPSISKMNEAKVPQSKILKWLEKKAPDSIGKRIGKMMEEKAETKELLDFARSIGLAEEEITPLMQGEDKQRWLAKIASKGERTQAKLGATRTALGSSLESMMESPGAKKVLTDKQQSKFIKSIHEQFEKMPSSVQKVISDDWQRFLEGERTAGDVVRLFRNVNHELGPKTKQLSLMKQPIQEILSESDRELGRTFNMTNKLYGRYASIAERLKPSIADKFAASGKGGALLIGMATGNVGYLKAAVSAEAASRLASEMLTNPRIQNLMGKMVTAINNNKLSVARNIQKNLSDEVSNVDARFAEQLDRINMEELLTD